MFAKAFLLLAGLIGASAFTSPVVLSRANARNAGKSSFF
jgi:hypothetical protein